MIVGCGSYSMLIRLENKTSSPKRDGQFSLFTGYKFILIGLWIVSVLSLK